MTLSPQGPGPVPTVGDTIWVTQTVSVPSGVTLRPADWNPPDPIERLGAPRVTLRGDSAEVAYPIVIWRAGPITLSVPGPLLLGEGGRMDSAPPRPVALRIASVLPAQPVESIAPQPRADFVPRTTLSLAPLLILLAVAVLLLTPLHWWWRRRGLPRPRPSLALLGAAAPPLDRWADAGETRAVASVAAQRLRSVIAARMPEAHQGLDTEDLLRVVRRRDDWPLGELRDLLHSLDEARFGSAGFPDAVGLARWADELTPRLAPEAA
ncbi:MAG: hypothetical protein ACTHM9_00575 [Gemmatimonadales bacterium]|jgi:hypothetical protein